MRDVEASMTGVILMLLRLTVAAHVVTIIISAIGHLSITTDG
jgi:hypothetical protein